MGRFLLRLPAGGVVWAETKHTDSYDTTDMRNTMNFGQAIEALKEGKRVSRRGWNGEHMWLCYMPATVIPADLVNERTRKHIKHMSSGDLTVGGYFVIYTAEGIWQPGWNASQGDMLGNDWEID